MTVAMIAGRVHSPALAATRSLQLKSSASSFAVSFGYDMHDVDSLRLSGGTEHDSGVRLSNPAQLNSQQDTPEPSDGSDTPHTVSRRSSRRKLPAASRPDRLRN